LPEKLVPNFAGRECHVVSAMDLQGFLDRSLYFSLKLVLNNQHEAEWTPFQTHCYAENLVAPGIEPETSGTVASNSDQQTTVAILPFRRKFQNHYNKLALRSSKLSCHWLESRDIKGAAPQFRLYVTRGRRRQKQGRPYHEARG
jgi:hypothetical protein